MPTFAAVDIGSNSVRLKIARLVRRRLEVLHEDREVVRLGESVFRNGTLSPQAMANTIKVMRRFHRAVQSYGTDQVRVAATSALRDARNSPAFVEWVRSATGWRVEIISGLEEGRLIHLGVMNGTRTQTKRVLLVDLGGGSCELTVSRDGHIRTMTSLPLGAVRLTEEFLPHDPPKKKERARLKSFIGKEIARVERRISNERVGITLATSGTAASLGAYAAARRRKRGQPRSSLVLRSEAVRIAAELAREPLAKRQELPGIGLRRAEIIIAGAEVFAELMTRLGLSGFRYSPLGLRDGLLAQMAADYDRGTRLGKQVESERWDALLAANKQYGVDSAHAEHVRNLALQLFAGLKPVHRMPGDYQEWLSAAAMLHDVGSFINRMGRHRHTYYIIAHSEIFGFTLYQRAIIAAIARYQGKLRPAPDQPIMRALAAEDRSQVAKAVVLLRLAKALEQSRRRGVRKIRVQIHDDRVLLRLTTKAGTGELEVWALQKERGYFRDVFGRELAAELS